MTVDAKLAALLPAEAAGWRASPGDHGADANTLFDLIDGGAEVYRALNVQQVVEREYQRPQHAAIIVDLFDMGSAEDAFGAFRNDVREHPEAGIGDGSEHETSALFFWKGRYFVAVVATEQTPEAIAAVLALGRAIAANIKQSGKPPALVDRLPVLGLNRQELYFFHRAESLTRLLPAAVDNRFALTDRTDALLARYRRADAGSDTLLLLIEYPSAAAASAAAQGLSGVSELRYESLRTSISVFKSKGPLLCAVLDASDRAVAGTLCDETLAAPRKAGR